jgi:predicted ATP-binding protein involved in virulence
MDQPRVKRIQVFNLFGLYNHDVHLRTEDRVTIIHGPNGVGKTAFLRIIESLFKGRYSQLIKVLFDRLTITFIDGEFLHVERLIKLPRIESNEKNDSENVNDFMLRFVYERLGNDNLIFDWRLDLNELQMHASRINSLLPYLNRVGPDLWEDERINTKYSSNELVLKYSHLLPDNHHSRTNKDPEWLVELRRSVNVHLVETQRLLKSELEIEELRYTRHIGRDVGMTSTVKTYAKALHRQISDKLALYAKESQALDQTFPQRMLDEKFGTLAVDKLKEFMIDLEEKRAELKRIGLIDDNTPAPFNIDALDRVNPTQITVMSLYVEDTGAKLGVLHDLSQRVILLLDNINRKFKNKNIAINRNTGLVAFDDAGNSLDLDSLSSGEQHEIVLMYDLLFRVQRNSLVLIDEPELSLHVTWQKSFLPELLKIVNTAGFDVILATHSPFIVGSRRDLATPLTPGFEEENEVKPLDENPALLASLRERLSKITSLDND